MILDIVNFQYKICNYLVLEVFICILVSDI